MKKWIFLVAIILFLAVGGISFFRIRKIECSCPTYYSARLNYLIGKSLIFLPKEDEISASLASYAEIATVNLKRGWPHTLIVQIKLHAPIGIVNDYLVDDVGKVLGSASGSDLPHLTVPETILPGKSLTSTQMNSVRALNSIANIFPGNLPAVLSGEVLQVTVGQTAVLLNVNSLPDSYTSALQLIFIRSKVDGKSPKRVDLRFNNPIMEY